MSNGFQEAKRLWRFTILPFGIFLGQNLLLILGGPYFVLLNIWFANIPDVSENTAREVALLLGHPAGGFLILWFPMSLLMSIWLIFRSIPKHLVFCVFILGVVLPSYFALLYFYVEGTTGKCVPEIETIGAAYYFSITTYTTLGYGDFSPEGFCRFLTSFQALLGLFTIGVVPAILVNELRKKLD